MGLGCMGMSEFYGPIDHNEAIRTFERAVDLGITHFDTANVYGLGHNEELVEKVLKKHRDQVVIASKFGILRDKITREEIGLSGHLNYIKQSCDQSLKHLKRVKLRKGTKSAI